MMFTAKPPTLWAVLLGAAALLWTLLLGAAVLAITTTSAGAQTHSRTHGTVTLGHGIGAITLGSSRAAVLKVLGKPDQHYTLPHGIAADSWGDGYMKVFFSKGKAVQIDLLKVTPPLPGGLTMQSTPDDVQAKYSGLKRGEFRSRGSASVVDYYDSRVKGFAFRFNRSLSPNPSNSGDPQLSGVIVHLGGANVIPDAGEVPHAYSIEPRN